MGWWNNLNFMSNSKPSWSAPSYRGDFGASSMTSQMGFQPQQTRPVDRFSQLEFPELQNQALSTYKDYLAKAPTREQYNPSIWEKIGAALAGSSTAWASKNPGAGLEVTRNFLDDRYNRAVQDWDIKGKGLAAAANIEENENTNKMRTWQGRNDSILKARDQERQERKTDADIDYQNKRIELTDAQISELKRKAATGESVDMVDNNGMKIFARRVVDQNGDARFIVDARVPSLEGRRQEFNEKDSTRNFNLRSMDTMFDNNLNAKEFGERQTQNAHSRQMDIENLGLSQRNTRVNEARGSAYVDYTKNGPARSSSISPADQEKAKDLAIQNVYEKNPQYRGLFTPDPRTGRVRLNDPAGLETKVTLMINGKQVTGTIRDLLEMEQHNILNRGRDE